MGSLQQGLEYLGVYIGVLLFWETTLNPKPFFEKKHDNAEAWVWAFHGLKVRALRIAGLGGMGLGLRVWGFWDVGCVFFCFGRRFSPR